MSERCGTEPNLCILAGIRILNYPVIQNDLAKMMHQRHIQLLLHARRNFENKFMTFSTTCWKVVTEPGNQRRSFPTLCRCTLLAYSLLARAGSSHWQQVAARRGNWNYRRSYAGVRATVFHVTLYSDKNNEQLFTALTMTKCAVISVPTRSPNCQH